MTANYFINRGVEFPFDDNKPTDDAHKAALGILANLLDRRGVGQELDSVEQDVRTEIVNDIAAIIRAAQSSN